MPSNERSNVVTMRARPKSRWMSERCAFKRGGVQCWRNKEHNLDHSFKCEGRFCPGLPWPASEIAHGVNCKTGGIRQ